MDRRRLIKQITKSGIRVGKNTLSILKELGSGGNGVAFLCQFEGAEPIVAKVYIPPDSRDLDERAYKRFKNEISLISKMRHPNVIKAFDSGTLQIGAYSLPFYTMPFAPTTLRHEINRGEEVQHLERKLRIFVRALLGVAALHMNGIVHRDLKPENILISKEGMPWVADLGIARITSELAATGLKTLASDRLRNQDYYAPEQRFGKATDVDHRADIYALGCILYELISGSPPVRTNSPKLKSFSDAFEPMDSIVDRMIAYDPAHRYSTLEDVLEDLSVHIGTVIQAHNVGAAPVTADLATMLKLLKSSNQAFRQQGAEIARRIGIPALPTLHELLGSSRREVRNAAAVALGDIAAADSLPYLISALYGNTDKASRFRPSADTAASAIARYPVSDRLKAIAQISEPIRPMQAVQIADGIPSDESFPIIENLAKNKMILLDWAENIWESLVKVDEQKAWPRIKDAAERDEIRYIFAVRRFLKDLSIDHQIELVRMWIESKAIDGVYDFENMLRMVLDLEVNSGTRLEFLTKLERRILASRGSQRDLAALRKQINDAVIRSQTSSVIKMWEDEE